MTKTEAIVILGGSLSRAAARVGVTIQAVSAWPEVLSDRLTDRVQAVLYRDYVREKEAQRLRRKKTKTAQSITTPRTEGAHK
jgi:hypothetical protein